MILRVYDSGKAHVTQNELAPVTLDGHHKVVQDVCWSVDDSCVLSASSDCTARLWVVHPPRPRTQPGTADEATVTASSTKTAAKHARVRRLENKLLPHPCHVYCARFVPHSDDDTVLQVATGAYDGVIRFWDVSSGRHKHGREDPLAELLTELSVHAHHVNSLVFDAAGVKMFSADESGCICVWVHSTATADASTPRSKQDVQLAPTWTHHQTVQDRETVGVAINRLHLHTSGRRVLVHGNDNVVRMLDLRTLSFMQHYHGTSTERAPVGSCFSGCGGFVLGGSDDGTALMWDVDTGAVVHTFAHLGISAAVTGVAFHPLDNLAAFCSYGHGQPVVVCRALPASAASHARYPELPSSAVPLASARTPLPTDPGAAAWYRSPSPSKHDLSHRGVPPPHATPHAVQVLGGVSPTNASGARSEEPLAGEYPPARSNLEDLQESRQRHVEKLLTDATAAIARRRMALEATSRIAVPIFSTLHPPTTTGIPGGGTPGTRAWVPGSSAWAPGSSARGGGMRDSPTEGAGRSSVASSLATDTSSGYKRYVACGVVILVPVVEAGCDSRVWWRVEEHHVQDRFKKGPSVVSSFPFSIYCL